MLRQPFRVRYCSRPHTANFSTSLTDQPDASGRPDDAVDIWVIVLGSLGVRVVSAVAALFARLAFPLHQPEQVTMFAAPSPFWDPFTHYDAGWYYQIARYGYRFVENGPPVGFDKPGKIAYFPLYPLLMGSIGRLFGHTAADFYLAGILVSWTAFALAMVVLF